MLKELAIGLVTIFASGSAFATGTQISGNEPVYRTGVDPVADVPSVDESEGFNYGLPAQDAQGCIDADCLVAVLNSRPELPAVFEPVLTCDHLDEVSLSGGRIATAAGYLGIGVGLAAVALPGLGGVGIVIAIAGAVTGSVGHMATEAASERGC